VPGVALRAVDNDIFLVNSDNAAVFHLNAVAAGVWHILEQSTTLAAAIDAVRQAFPAADARKVNRDVRNVFDALEQGGLIRAIHR
jgi:Coenzyme PQQ synthesis protein D (PqqD)